MGLINLLPDYYKASTQVIELQDAYGSWSDALQTAREDLFLQINVSTATWGLQLWENILGLETDISKTDDYRRSRIMSKLRGQGTTTVAMMQNVSESFSNGEVAIVEYPDEYRFEIIFTGTMGIPPNMDDLTSAVNEIKPAHLDYSFIYIYRLHNELLPYTHAYLSTYTHGTLRSGSLT